MVINSKRVSLILVCVKEVVLLIWFMFIFGLIKIFFLNLGIWKMNFFFFIFDFKFRIFLGEGSVFIIIGNYLVKEECILFIKIL